MSKKEIKYLLRNEKEALFQAIRSSPGRHCKRDYAICQTALYCALRASEIGLLFEQDIRFTSQGITIYCRRLKGSHNNTILIIDPDVEAALKEYLSIKQNIYGITDFLFPSQKGGKGISRKTLDKMIKNYATETTIPDDKRHMHVFKHTRAVDLGESGAELSDIQWWLGHKSIKNTMIYAQYTINRQMRLYQLLKEERNNL